MCKLSKKKEACNYEKTIRKSLGIKVLGVVNCLALCLTAYTANLACNWLYYQEEEPEEVKKMRKF